MPHIYQQDYTLTPTSGEALPVLDLTACGFVNTEDERQFNTGDYVAVYFSKGNGTVSFGSKSHQLSAGDAIICRPHEVKRTTVSEPSEYYWFSFRGREATDMLSALKLTSKEKYFVGHDNELTAYMDKAIDEWNKNETASFFISTALTIAVLGMMSRLAVRMVPQDQNKGHEKIAPAINSINSDCTSKLSVDDYARMCNLSTSYFTHLFTSVTGFSPMEYKQLQRINIAKNLLSTTNLSIKEISTVIGFKDPLYFGRCFKQSTGQTPSSYRSKK